MDLNTLYARTVESWAERVNAVAARPAGTSPRPCRNGPCATWSTTWPARTCGPCRCVQGSTIAEVGDRFDGDVLGDDPIHRRRGRRPGGDAGGGATLPEGGTVHLSYGEERLEEYVCQLAADHLVHGWDLAAATGATRVLDPDAWVPWRPGSPSARTPTAGPVRSAPGPARTATRRTT